MSKYKYSFHDERGEFSAYVEDEQGNTVWNVSYPDYYENVDGELIESSTIFEDGFMKDANDIEGLENYLKSLNILKSGDELMDESGYMGKGEEDEEYQEMADGGGVGGKVYQKVKITIRDVDMGGDIVYKSDHYFRKDQIENKTNNELGEYIAKKYGLDYGNTFKYSVVRTNETKTKMAKGAVVDSYSVAADKKINPLEINEFISYCNEFYGKAGVYRKDFNGGFSVTEIKRAVIKYIEELGKQKTWGDGDSLDRERVRYILEGNQFADGGVAEGNEVFITNALTTDKRILSKIFDYPITHKQLYDHYKKQGYEIKESQIYNITNREVLQNYKDALANYIKQKFSKNINFDLTLIPYSVVQDKMIFDSHSVITSDGNEIEINPNDLFDSFAFGGVVQKEFQVEFTWSDADDESRSVYIKADTKEEAEDKAKQKFGKAYEGFKIIQIQRSMETGGTLEKRLKKKLSQSFELPMEVAVYVPSTQKANEIISKKEFNARIEEVETYLSNLFGGYSATTIDGGYISDDKEKGLIQENVARVASFGSKDGFEDKFDELRNKISEWCNSWSQESIALEFEGDMFYIEAKAINKLEKGGEADSEEEDEEKEKENERLEELMEEYDLPAEVIEEYASNMGIEINDITDIPFNGRFDSEEDFAEDLVEQGVVNNLSYYLEMTSLDMRLLAGEEADNRVEDMTDEDLLKAMDMEDEANEYEELKDEIDDLENDVDDLKSKLDDYMDEENDEMTEGDIEMREEKSNELKKEIELKENKLENLQNKLASLDTYDEVVDKAREELRDVYYDDVRDELEKDAVGYFVDSLGYAEEDLAKNSSFSVDYEKLAKDLSYDFTFIEHNGDVYVFSSYMYGGMTYAKGGGIPNNYRGRTTEDIWNSLTENQRIHFMFDHFDGLGVKENEIEEISDKQFKDLNEDVQDEFKYHTIIGQYADGGMMANGGGVKKELLSEEHKQFIREESQEAGQGYTYRYKVLRGEDILLKEKNNAPIQKWYFDYEDAIEIAKRLNKVKGNRDSKMAQGGGVKEIDYANVFPILKDKIDNVIDDIPYENAYGGEGEEVEYKSRDGFFGYTDGGYEYRWFEYVSMMSGSGKSLPTKPLDAELNRQVQYNYDFAKENFIEKYPQIVEKLGEDKINYSDLQDAGYDSEAEELSEMEMDYSGEDSIMMRVFAYYYSPENRRGENGKHTISLFGDVNLESPYHRAGNLDDSIEITFTFNSLDELSKKMDSNLLKIVGWFNGDNYNNSKKEMKVRRMADGGMIQDFEIYDEQTGKSLFIKARSLDEAEGISETIDFDDYENGDIVDVLDDIDSYPEYAHGGMVTIPNTDKRNFLLNPIILLIS